MKTKIQAETPEEFKEIQDKIKELDETISDQIQLAYESLAGTMCEINGYSTGDKITIYIPKSVTQITEFADFVSVFTPEFIFKIVNKRVDTNYEYKFI